MAKPDPATPPTADLGPAGAALPAKKEAVRKAFDRLAACSPYPLPFTWEGLDAHISGIQSSVSRRFRQLQVLEAARTPSAVAPPEETKNVENQQEGEEEEKEEEVEVEAEEEEEEEGDDEEEGDGDGEVEEEEVEEEIEEEEVEEEAVEEAKDATMYGGEQEAGDEIHLTNEVQNAKEEPEASEKVQEQNEDEEMVPKKDKEAEKETCQGVHEDGKKEQEAEEREECPYIKPGVRNAKVSWREDRKMARKNFANYLIAICTSMDANMLAKFICCNNRTVLGNELLNAMRHAPDAAALALEVVKLFLSTSKELKVTKVWNTCIHLIRCMPASMPKPSGEIIEQAKQVAKDWQEMIYMPECPGNLEFLGAWGLLYFLMSYNIVSEFDTSEIIRLFSMVPRQKQRKNTMEFCKGLGIADKITDVIDHLIEKGQQLEVFHLAHVFNLLDKYPPVALLKQYIETAKQTALEIRSQSLICTTLSMNHIPFCENCCLIFNLV